MSRRPFAIAITLSLLGGTAFADDSSSSDADKDKPKRGSFDAGIKVRLPSGPDDMGKFAQFNWVGVDVIGRYFILDQVSLDGVFLFAPVKQNIDPTGMTDSKIFGGVMVGPTINLDKAFGLDLKIGTLTQGAVLLSDKDFPLYVGDYQLAAKAGPWIKLNNGALELNFVPQLVFENDPNDKIIALQVPVSAAVKVGQTFKLALETGIYTGDSFDPRPSQGGRIAAGAAIDLKVGHILAHVGAGFASLLTTDDPSGGNFYKSIGDSIYIDLNAKYVK